MTNTTDIQNNPLLDFSGLPRFADIRPEHVVPAIDFLLKEAQQALEHAVSDSVPATWEDMTKALDVHTEKLSRAWSATSHLQAVKDNPELREAINTELPKITEFWTKLGQDERLYAKYKAIAGSPALAQIQPAQLRALDLTLKSFSLSGAGLQGDAKTRFAQIQEELAQLSQRFSENLLDVTDNWEMYVDDYMLEGVPEDILSAMHQAVQDKGREGFRLSLQPPIYIPVMQYAQNRQLRETLYIAYVTRASELGEAKDAKYNNTPLIDKIITLRQEEAQLLGYRNYGEVSLALKMAQTPHQVIEFLRELAAQARPYAEKDLKELCEFASEELSLSEPQAWDIAYISEKLKERRYAFSEQEVKAYFPQPKVIEGLFHIAQALFDVQIMPDTSPAAQQVWDAHVKLYRLERHGQLIGQFYTDLSARPGKRGGAWMDEVRTRWLRRDSNQLQTPVAQLVCNFASGVDGKPPLLTHDDVITVFHEFGHSLHHLLTQVNELDVSGISGVEWDAVELPSQFMENFCWEWDVLQQISAHVDTGKPLPQDLYKKMLAAKNFQSGMQTLRQIEFSLFDMLLHSDYAPEVPNPAEPAAPPPEPPGMMPFFDMDMAPGIPALDDIFSGSQTVQQLLNQVRQEVAVLIPPVYNRFQNSFGHIFAGGYAAGYYSYKWAEVLSADAYAAFEEAAGPNGNILSPEVGIRYRQEILEQGGARPALESFMAFRGREPQIDALLRHQGMVE